MRVSTALCALAIFMGTVQPAAAEGGGCGNGVRNHEEECDPGGQLYCDGNPHLGTCRTGADCASGVNCYFGLSCCKFNCQFVGQGATCYDGDDCTGPDRCNNVGACSGPPNTGNTCDDGNTCTGNDTCVQGECVGALPPECDDHDPCSDDFCDAETGCGHTFNTAPCNDGQLCTGNDTCHQGACGGTPTIPATCNDSNLCTDDGCNADANGGAGACVHQNNTLPCSDGQFCTQNDVCGGGACHGSSFTPPSCIDDNACTDDICNPQANGGTGACAQQNNSAPCNDGNGCTVNDQCSQGTCSGSTLHCDDGNLCTTDSCSASLGACVHENNTLPCNDGQFCTENDICGAGACAGSTFTPPSCNDGNGCTDDACNPQGNGGGGACAHANNTAPCDDGAFCTTTDRCGAGQCVSGPAYDCNDGNVCTLDSCNEAADACVHIGDSSKAGQSCDDASLCTSGDVCDASGGCAGTPIVCNDGDDVCTADTCNPASGCVFDVVIENPTCMSCMDGIDNEGDGDTDAEDCDCNLLCESFHYAVVANRDSTRRTAYFGKDSHAARGIDPELGSASRNAPYPLGPSTSSACSQGKLELVERSAIDGVATATTRADFGDGDEMRLGFFTGFVPPGEVRTTGIPPFVGPQEVCSDTPLACTGDSECPQGETCRPMMAMFDPGNQFVDLSGTHPEYADCEDAKASLPIDFATLFALTPTQDLGNLRYKQGQPPIVVTGPGVHVVHITSLRIENGVTMQVIGDTETEAVIFQIDRAFNLGVRSRVELVGGLKPDHVLWLVDRRGRAYVGNQEVEPASDDLATLPGTLLAPEKNIIVGKKARVAGALLGRQVQLNEKAVVSHRPYIAAIP